MSDLLKLTNLTALVKPGNASPWVYSGVDESWTRVNVPVNAQIDQELVGNRYLLRESYPDDISIRWKVGDISNIHQNSVGFSTFDGKWRQSSQNQPDLFGIVQSNGTTLNFFEFDSNTAQVNAGGLPGGLTLAVNDELRVQIHKVSNDYVLHYKWRRPPGGSEQIIRTSTRTNTQLLSYLAAYDLFLRMTSTGNANVTSDIIKEIQMEVTDAGTTWLLLPDQLGTKDNAPDDLYEEGAQTLLASNAGEIPEESLPIPTEGQLYPLGDGREFIE